MTNTEHIEELKDDINVAMDLYKGSITSFAREVWINKADRSAHELAKLTNWYDT